MSGKTSKNTEATLATELVAGIQKHLASVQQMTVGGSTFTPAQATAQLTALATLRGNANAAKAAWAATLSTENSQAPTLRAFLTSFVSYVRATFGNAPNTLADFGLAPRKAPTPLTGEQVAAKAAKAEATRKARGTVGKTKKLAITGNVSGVVVTPITVTVNKPAPSPAEVTASAQSAALNGASHQ
jgi:hypothetical protein